MNSYCCLANGDDVVEFPQECKGKLILKKKEVVHVYVKVFITFLEAIFETLEDLGYKLEDLVVLIAIDPDVLLFASVSRLFVSLCFKFFEILVVRGL
jgi:hypothetical protein